MIFTVDCEGMFYVVYCKNARVLGARFARNEGGAEVRAIKEAGPPFFYLGQQFSTQFLCASLYVSI